MNRDIAKDRKQTAVNDTSFINLAVLIGMNRQIKLQAAIIVITAFVLITGGTMLASYIAFHTDKSWRPDDFCQKGTISNLSQDMSTPHGRLWSTALVLSGVLLLTSMYPFWLYRCWAPWLTRESNPLVNSVFESKTERLLRTIWVVLPAVGFILSGIIPSVTLEGTSGYEIVMTGVHNVCAPLSMLLCMVMETVQLHFGENAFARLFGSTRHHPATAFYGDLKAGQRLRAITALLAWFSGLVFVSVQGYLALGPNNCLYWLALVSYVGEVSGIVLHFALPAIAGAAYLMEEEGSALESAQAMIREHLVRKAD